MHQEVKDKWLAALRSGTYQQGQCRLEVNGKFCCLGVLCDLAFKEGVVTRQENRGSEEALVEDVIVTYGDVSGVLPPEVRTWAGLTYSDPTVPYLFAGADLDSLTHLNDNEGLTFEQIADLIEEHL